MFDFARSKDDYPKNKRKILYKIYKTMKYNKEIEDEEEKEKMIDAVNQYTLNKNYTNRIKLSRLDRMKFMIEKQRHRKRNEELVKQKIMEKTEEESSKEKEEVLEENKILIDEEEKDESEEDYDVECYEEEDSESDQEFGSQPYHLGADDEEEESDDEMEELEDISDDDLMWYDGLDPDVINEDGKIDLAKIKNKEGDLDPRLLYFFVDCDEEELKDLSEEDRKILEAYKNSQKNIELLRKSKIMILKKRRLLAKNKNNKILTDELMNDAKEDLSINANNITLENISNDNAEDNLGVSTPAKDTTANVSHAGKRKNSVNSVGSGNRKNSVSSLTSKNAAKKKVVFKIHSNEFNQYDMLKPINLVSARKMNNIKEVKPTKGSLRIRNKNKK